LGSGGGWLTLICGADGLPEVLAALAPRMGSAAVLPLAAREGRAALRILLRARKGPAHDGDRESYTPAAGAVLRGGASLSAQFS